MQKAIKNLETGTVAFESKTTGRPIYMYFTPLDISGWQLSIFIDEAVIFKDLISLRKLLIFTGIAEAFFLLLYFLWNIRGIRQLEKSNAEIEKQNIELDSERKISDVLCRDYTAVYHADLADDTAALLKIDPHTNIASMPDIQIRRKFGYTEHIQSYCEQFVDDSAKKEFTRIMARDNLLNELKYSPRHTYRYQSIPNQEGYEYFEVQALKINDTDSEDKNFNVMIAFRHIDDVVTAEQKYQIELEKRLESEQKQNELLIGISRIYHSIFRIDLQADTYEELFCHDDNSHLMRSSGTASSELKDLCERFVAPQHKEQMIQFFDISTAAQRLQNETSVSAECMTMDGNWHHASFITKRRGENGEVTHILYVTRIISDEKHREERLISIVENANEANRAKTDFISKVAHDIRTPMNSIFGFLEIAEQHIKDSDKVKYSLDKIRTSGKFLKDLVNDVLDISKMENGKIALHLEKMLFREMLEEFAISIKNGDYDKNHSFNIDIHNIVHNYIIADSLRIRQIYANVLSNAVKYTPNGGHIDFTVYQEEIPDSDKVRIVSVISDTGIGMSEEFMAKMFDKFERGTDTRINTVNGYGLGLSIVKQLVNLMNGKISVTSAPGKGTIFRIEIEAAYTEDSAPLPSSDDKTDMAENAAICAGMHILVAEDNELNQEVITELLNMYNITCECAGDGAICVERFKQENEGFFDAVLMDMQMPNMNGLEAAKAIRSLLLPWTKTIPIIAMTANAMKDDVRSCLNAGMNVHLSKPVDMNKLLSVLAGFKHK